MPPEQAALRFGIACLLGAALGLFYGFLRPLRRRRVALWDGVFILGAFWAWIFLSFGVCGGDLRLGYTAGLFGGCLVFDLTVGRWLRPVFFGVWGILFRLIQGVIHPVCLVLKKFFHFAKKIICIWAKMGYNKME